MWHTNAPAILWDHCMQLMAAIHSHTALDLFASRGDTPIMVTLPIFHIWLDTHGLTLSGIVILEKKEGN